MAAIEDYPYSFREMASDISFILGNSDKIFYMLNPNLDEKIELLCNRLKKVRENGGVLYITAEGRSGYAGNFFGERLENFGFNVYLTKKYAQGAQVLLRKKFKKELINPHSHGLAISGSGQTVSTLDNAKFLKEAGVKLTIFTSYTDSQLAKLAELEEEIIKIPGGLRKGDIWKTERDQIDSDISKKLGYSQKDIEAVELALEKATRALYLGSFSEMLTIVMTETITTKIGNYFRITQQYAAEKHVKDDRPQKEL